MKKFYVLCLLALCFYACSGPSRSNEWQQWRSDNGKVKVLTTIAMIADLVKVVGGDNVDTITLIKGELDPHSYQLVKGDDEKFAYAQLIFFNGLGLEHGPSLQQILYNNPKAIGLGDKIRERDPAKILKLKNQTDPHIWMDVSIWAKNIPFIVEASSKADPSHADEYQKNGSKLIEDMTTKHAEVHAMLQKVPEDNRYLVTSHDAFNYFTRAYLATDKELANGDWQKRFAAPEGLAPESQLSASDIQEIINHLNEYRIHVVFPESNVSKDSIRKIVQAAKEKGLEVMIADTYLYADAMGQQGSDGDTYLKMIQHNADAITRCLSREKTHDK